MGRDDREGAEGVEEVVGYGEISFDETMHISPSVRCCIYNAWDSKSLHT